MVQSGRKGVNKGCLSAQTLRFELKVDAKCYLKGFQLEVVQVSKKAHPLAKRKRTQPIVKCAQSGRLGVESGRPQYD